MATAGQSLSERISDVYTESQKSLGFQQKTAEMLNYIAHTHTLHFNSYYPQSRLKKLGKQVFQKLTRPALQKQVEFNVAVREILLQTSAAIADMEHQIKELSLSVLHAEEQRAASEEQPVTEKQVATEEQLLKDSGLWFNEPIKVGFRQGGTAYWDKTTERIVEKAFVLQSLARLHQTSEAAILDVGAAESLLAYELASLGYAVTAMDIRPFALSHPDLKFVQGDINRPVFLPESFDCVTALSMLEHIGLGWYGDEVGGSLDVQAVQQIHRLLKPGGHFIFTTPYGKRAVTPVHRIYDKALLEELVGPFQVVHSAYGVRLDGHTLRTTPDEAQAADKEHDPESYLPGAVAMLVCVKAEASPRQ